MGYVAMPTMYDAFVVLAQNHVLQACDIGQLQQVSKGGKTPEADRIKRLYRGILFPSGWGLGNSTTRFSKTPVHLTNTSMCVFEFGD